MGKKAAKAAKRTSTKPPKVYEYGPCEECGAARTSLHGDRRDSPFCHVCRNPSTQGSGRFGEIIFAVLMGKKSSVCRLGDKIISKGRDLFDQSLCDQEVVDRIRQFLVGRGALLPNGVAVDSDSTHRLRSDQVLELIQSELSQESHSKLSPVSFACDEVESKKDGPDSIDACTIPTEFRTKAISKQKAAALLGRPNPDSGVKWLNKCIADATISCEYLSRTSCVFDKRQFPNSAQSQL